MFEYVIGVLGVLSTIVAAIFKWFWSKIEGNDDSIKNLRADQETLQGRLYGNDRGQAGDINRLQQDVEEVKEALSQLDSIENKIDQIITDQRGDPDVDHRQGTLNEIDSLNDKIDELERKMESEHEHIDGAIKELLNSMDNPPDIDYPSERQNDYEW